MNWIFWVLIAVGITVVKRVTVWAKKGLTPKSVKLLEEIGGWKKAHIVKRTRQKQKVTCYLSDNGNVFPLGVYESQVKDIAEQAEQVAKIYEERVALRKQLPADLRKDSMLDRIEGSFLTAMEQYLSELKMFQFDRIDDIAYSSERLVHIELLLENASSLMQHYGDYMLSLSQAAASDIDTEREMIEAAVSGMEQAVAEARDDIPLPDDAKNQTMQSGQF